MSEVTLHNISTEDLRKIVSEVIEEKLKEFYRRTYPGGIGWRQIAEKVPEVKSDSNFGRLFLNWLMGVVLVYSFLFGLGHVLFGEYLSGIPILLLGIIAAGVIYSDLKKRDATSS